MPATDKGHKVRKSPRQRAPARFRKPDLKTLAHLFDSWKQDDATEQMQTFEALKRGLDEGRPEGYKLFP